MNRVAQNGYQTPDVADDLRAAHDAASADPVDADDLVPAIAFAFDADAEDIAVEDVLPTDNAARPRSILMVEFTVDGAEYVAEIQCTEEMNIDDEEAVDHHDDGTMAIPVSAMGEPTYAYETVDVTIYETSA